MPTPTPEQVIRGHQAAVASVRSKVLTFAATAWRAQGSYRDADIDRLVALLVPRVQAGQVQVANLTSAYLAQIATLTLGVAVSPVGVDRADVLTGRGVDPAEVYRRPAKTVYAQLAAGASYTDAVNAGLRRLESVASMDMQMAKVRQARTSMQAAGFRGYRRTLTGAENCALCVLASTQRYRVKNLLPIHPGCDCGIAPITEAFDPGQVINRPLVEALQNQVADFTGTADRSGVRLGLDKRTATGQRVRDYTDVMVRDHGEYGLTLSWRSDKFTRAADLA